jgi:DNA mismatch repair protein MutS2
VITGPNTGGKTVALKTLGLLCAMALCGLHIPADSGSAVPVYRARLADRGDEQSIEPSLSTFSSHMTNIVKMLETGGDGSLMLFDELGAGTDPSEGAALAVAIIERARSAGTCVVATTHYSQLKAYALTKPGVINASCEFDIETLRPTYKLLIGVPGKSNAFAISRRLGLPEDVIDEAGRLIDGDSVSLEDVLGGLEAERKRTREELEDANRMLESARADSERAAKYLAELRRDRESAHELARREAKASLDAARETASAVMSELADIRKRAAEDGDMLRLNEAKADIFRKLNDAAASLDAGTDDGEPEPPGDYVLDSGAAVPGDTVMLRAYGTRAVVESIAPDGALSLVAGNIRLTARPDEVARVKGKAARHRATPQKTPDGAASGARVGAELDIRGMASDEAADLVERYISDALMSKLETVTVIHGKGTGALRRAVHETLRRSPSVKSFRLGRYGEGETGVTVADIR